MANDEIKQRRERIAARRLVCATFPSFVWRGQETFDKWVRDWNEDDKRLLDEYSSALDELGQLQGEQANHAGCTCDGECVGGKAIAMIERLHGPDVWRRMAEAMK